MVSLPRSPDAGRVRPRAVAATTHIAYERDKIVTLAATCALRGRYAMGTSTDDAALDTVVPGAAVEDVRDPPVAEGNIHPGRQDVVAAAAVERFGEIGGEYAAEVRPDQRQAVVAIPAGK